MLKSGVVFFIYTLAYVYYISETWISNNISHLKTFYEICIIKWFIDIVSPDNNLKEHLTSLLASFPNVDTKAMGFPEHWELEPLWSK